MSGFESNWANTSDTVRNRYGESEVNEKFGGQVSTSGKTKEVSWKFTADDLPNPGDPATAGKMEFKIPARAMIKSAYFHIIEGFDGATAGDQTPPDLNIGLRFADGTVDVDGIGVIPAALLPVAGLWVPCTGEYPANNGNISDAKGGAWLECVGVADISGGKAELVLEYIDGSTP